MPESGDSLSQPFSQLRLGDNNLDSPVSKLPPGHKEGRVGSLSLDTPYSMTSHNSEHLAHDVERSRPFIAQELQGHILERTKGSLVVEVPKSTTWPLPEDAEIEEYLRRSRLYDSSQARWTKIPQDPKAEKDLYNPIKDIFSEVLAQFHYDDTRSVVANHSQFLDHEVKETSPNTTTLKSAPDILVLGRGKIESEYGYNFRPDDTRPDGKRKNYKSCASPVEIKTEKNKKPSENLIQIAVYARQCFIQQQNRLFVYCPIITESQATFYMFDRSGAYYSLPFNIHAHAVDFVRLILTISSPDCSSIGFDTRIYWEDKRRKFRFTNAKKEVTVYEILDVNGKAYFARDSIRGRGTCCWAVKDDKGNRYIVKDQWASLGRVSEHDFFVGIEGLFGVAEMVDFAEGRTVSSLRGITDYSQLPDSAKKYFKERTLHTTIFKDGGKPIYKFKTRAEVLYALRDAIKGHQALWERRILHRDISINNILITPDGHDARGLIIDLDMAARIDREKSLAGSDFLTGTRAFQSINVLSSWKFRSRPHDHRDELESFFYVAFWICHLYEGPGKFVTPFPKLLAGWEDPDPAAAASSKMYFFSYLISLDQYPVTEFFGQPFQNLITNLYFFLEKHITATAKHPKGKMYPIQEDISAFQQDSNQDYEQVLKYFDEAIEELKQHPDLEDPASEPLSQPDFGIPNANTSDTSAPRTPPSSSEQRLTRSSARMMASNEDDVFSSLPVNVARTKPPPGRPHAPRNPSSLGASSDDW